MSRPLSSGTKPENQINPNVKTAFLKPLISYFDRPWPISWAKEFSNKKSMWVEIGFGLGEVLLKLSSENPDKNFIGIEQHDERILKTLESLDADGGRTNVRLLNADARQAFQYLISPRSIEKVFSLFPCPWPKREHTKHRLFHENFLKLVNSRLVPKGSLQIVTDQKDYFTWIAPQALASGFKIEKNIIEAKFNTKFERKWQKDGQKEFFELNLIKSKHCNIPVLKPSPMRHYFVPNFDPKNFKFQDLKGEISIIFKDMVFDQDRKKALIQLVVCEEELIQHVWFEIIHKQKHWLIQRAQGQHFFETPGTQQAIKAVYESITAA
jgi:tRNA (guanine-N7-)-methyltransferase